MTHDELKEYFALMESFDSRQISSAVFEREFLSLFKGEQRIFPEEIFEVLNDLFLDVDAFVDDATIRGQGDLDEQQLRASARAAVEKLQGLCTG